MPPEHILPCHHSQNSHTPPQKDLLTLSIEAYKPGYPRFSALIASSSNFSVFRRFLRIRTRLLLLKQDEISQLEGDLDCVDEEEAALLFLGSSRLDGNARRTAILSKIESKLADYDRCLETTNRILQYDGADRRDVSSLQNWLDGNGSIAREESAYLSYREDLFSLAPMADIAKTRLEAWVEDRMIQFLQKFRYYQGYEKSTDPSVYLYSGTLITTTAKALLISLVTVLLLLPIVVCNLITGTASRIVIVMASTILYLLVLSSLTRAKTTELVVAATTYATVLIVFVSGTEGHVT